VVLYGCSELSNFSALIVYIAHKTPRVSLMHQEGASAPVAEARFSMVIEGVLQPSLTTASGGRAATPLRQRVFIIDHLTLNNPKRP